MQRSNQRYVLSTEFWIYFLSAFAGAHSSNAIAIVAGIAAIAAIAFGIYKYLSREDDVDDFEDDFEDDFDFEFGDAEEVKQEGASDEETVTATSEDEE